jgi:hypothetical protein
MELMSQNIVNMMNELIKNQGIARLISNDIPEPFTVNVANPSNLLMNRIHPVPFDIEATTLDGTFLRIYYNQGTIGKQEIITESQVHIDIICSRNLWLIKDEVGRSGMRPYELAGRVVDMLGRNSNNSTIRLEFEGYQHLYINAKFDCIRLYANYDSVEASPANYTKEDHYGIK